MADWFKSYENDLDDERLQWAMSEQQQVAIVYFALLSRCCRDKSGTLSWDSELDLFALSNKLRISVPIINQSLQLLSRIKFIETAENTIKVLRWNERQSEYCQNKTRLQNQSGEKHHTKRTPDTIPIVSRHSPDIVDQEESRGDKRRIEGEPNPPFNGKLTASERITFEKSLDRIKDRLVEIKEADLPGFSDERKSLRAEKSRLLGLLGLKA